VTFYERPEGIEFLSISSSNKIKNLFSILLIFLNNELIEYKNYIREYVDRDVYIIMKKVFKNVPLC